MVESTNTTATLGATNSLCLDAKTLDLLVCPELRVAALALLPWQTTGNPVRRVHWVGLRVGPRNLLSTINLASLLLLSFLLPLGKLPVR